MSSLNTITVDGVTYNYDEYSSSLTNKTATESMVSKDTFLQLMVKQMQYPDPLDPMDNSEYLSQLAQFSALEQMTNVASTMEKVNTLVENMDTSLLVGQLTNMIDKDVQWTSTSSEGITSVTTGTVKGVSISDGAPSLIVEVTDADGNTATTKVDISTLTRVGSGT